MHKPNFFKPTIVIIISTIILSITFIDIVNYFEWKIFPCTWYGEMGAADKGIYSAKLIGKHPNLLEDDSALIIRFFLFVLLPYFLSCMGRFAILEIKKIQDKQ